MEADRIPPIIGIGASAGGLEALEQFFRHVPSVCGAGFVVIQHLDPTRKGIA
ncbi:chemotaxis protein CheB [Methylomonas sp. MED-D]|uniref:chemotaxis protein CheB n=1 Tax=Methylomonas sp. MED-D TaxID=3418768 RepID=UPI003D054C50